MGNYCVSGAVLAKTGTAVSGAILASTENFDYAISGAECIINCATRHNWSDDYATLNEDVRYILEDTCAALAAVTMATTALKFYETRIEGEDVINVCRDIALRNMSILRDKKTQEFITSA